MNSYLYIEINMFSVIILLLIYTNLKRTENYMTEQKLYIHILMFTISILVFDTLMWAFDGIKSPLCRTTLIISTLIYFLLQPLICMLWSLYIDFQINRDRYRLRKLLLFLMIPSIINSVLSFLSLSNNIFFYFNDQNEYQRGKLFFLLPILVLSYVVYSFIYVIKNRKRIQDDYFKSFISFIFPPIAGAFIQFLCYGLSLIWVGMTLSIFIIFINIQNQQMYSDHLTGLFNRRQLDFYLHDIISKKKIRIAGVLLDFNSFKRINDQFGHSIGDEALKYTSYILKKSFKNSFIARFGGDEFVILMEVKDREELDNILLELRKNIEQFNIEKNLPYTIDYSIGADLYPNNSKMTGQEFLNYIDSLMYKEKHALENA